MDKKKRIQFNENRAYTIMMLAGFCSFFFAWGSMFTMMLAPSIVKSISYLLFFYIDIFPIVMFYLRKHNSNYGLANVSTITLAIPIAYLLGVYPIYTTETLTFILIVCAFWYLYQLLVIFNKVRK